MAVSADHGGDIADTVCVVFVPFCIAGHWQYEDPSDLRCGGICDACGRSAPFAETDRRKWCFVCRVMCMDRRSGAAVRFVGSDGFENEKRRKITFAIKDIKKLHEIRKDERKIIYH